MGKKCGGNAQSADMNGLPISRIELRGGGCPECAKADRTRMRRLQNVKEKGSLADLFPEIASEWLFKLNGEITPETITSGSSEKVWWKCSKCGHEWSAIISNRTRNGQGCPEC